MAASVAEDRNDRLSVFGELSRRKAPWDQRVRVIRERFPSIVRLDWNRAFSDDLELFARVLRDILKLEQAQPGRPGPRPSLDVAAATRRMQQFLGKDYTLEAFPEAFRILAGNRSIRHLAAKVGLDRTLVYRLLHGRIEPDAYALDQIANAFGKSPSYFLEYRIAFIVAALTNRLEWSPETTVGLYRELARSQKASIE